ncbi:MAG: His/Gly/Thr/Pro-type tRNA ligase C-terminal domain-containing protein, partial [Candidatus Binatus sp.]
EGMTPGFKFNDWEMRGVPVRIEIGPRDVASGEAVLARRDKSGPESKSKASLATIADTVGALLGEIQKNLYAQAKAAMVANTRTFDDYAVFRKHMEGEGGGGFAYIYWCGNPVCETRIREETKATCRAIPLTNDGVAAGKCLVCGEQRRRSSRQVPGMRRTGYRARVLREVLLICRPRRFLTSPCPRRGRRKPRSGVAG